MSDAAESGVKSLGIFSTLQSATEIKFFLLAMAFILLIDDVFIQLKQNGLYNLAVDKNLMAESNLGLKVILIFVIFSFLTSLILKSLMVLLDFVYLQTIGRIGDLFQDILDSIFRQNAYAEPRKHDCVTLYELYVEAHETKDSYLLGRYAECQNLKNEYQSTMAQEAIFSCYCLVMLLWNWVVGMSGNNQSLSVVVSEYIGAPDAIWFAIGFLLLVMFHRLYRPEKYKWFYCPTLAQTLIDREKEYRKKFEPPRD